MVTEEQLNLKNIKKSAWLTFTEFLHEVNHTPVSYTHLDVYKRQGLGRISELGYGMLFGSDVKKQFFQKRIKGRGYCDVGTSVISEFYTPLVPKGHDLDVYKRQGKSRHSLYQGIIRTSRI